jgi:hypothetical protein
MDFLFSGRWMVIGLNRLFIEIPKDKAPTLSTCNSDENGEDVKLEVKDFNKIFSPNKSAGSRNKLSPIPTEREANSNAQFLTTLILIESVSNCFASSPGTASLSNDSARLISALKNKSPEFCTLSATLKLF